MRGKFSQTSMTYTGLLQGREFILAKLPNTTAKWQREFYPRL
jgi:hypothetical protein